ncbi:MAG TPA: hypothetical protein VK524_06855 [Polyangiaceae bacterium]|nr:hypothetical protein [Polyangiaceae bacterium]
MTRRGSLVIAYLIASQAGCDGRDVQVLGSSSQHDAGDERGSCPDPPGADFCQSVPRLGRAQNVDGRALEFCGLSPMLFEVSRAAWTRNPPQPLPEIVFLRAAWSPEALHVHAHVIDPKIIVSRNALLSEGDGVEFYAAATDQLSGPTDGARDGGALQIIVTPQSGGEPARARIYYHPEPGVQLEEPLDPGAFASRIVDDGYDVEVKIPWRASVSAGMRVGFDFGLNITDSDFATGREQQAAIGYRDVTLPTNCTADVGPQPFCDNRTWCVPLLE